MLESCLLGLHADTGSALNRTLRLYDYFTLRPYRRKLMTPAIESPSMSFQHDQARRTRIEAEYAPEIAVLTQDLTKARSLVGIELLGRDGRSEGFDPEARTWDARAERVQEQLAAVQSEKVGAGAAGAVKFQAISRWLLLFVLVSCGATTAADWRPVTQPDPRDAALDFSYQKRTAVLGEGGTQLTAHLAFFNSRAYRLEVVDLGAGDGAAAVRMEDAADRAGCVAGVNGGFFHPDYRPLGLMISGGQRTGQLESTKLLSGVVYSDDRGVHLVRRAGFRDHAGIGALLQTGPYLVERGRPVRGLSTTRSARRTFIATDWRRHWVIGATTSRVTLAELADALATPDALTSWPVDRGINLDGGSSTGFFVDGDEAQPSVKLRPLKRVRNLLCIHPR